MSTRSLATLTENAMQTVDELFGRLKGYVARASLTFGILDTLGGLIVGGLFGAWLSDGRFELELAIAGITYLLLLSAKFSMQQLFPSAVVEELRSRMALVEVKEQLARRDVISGFITHSITALNSQTCAITSEAANTLCSQAVSEGLSKVIEPLINRPQYLFDCNESKFTVAALVTYRGVSEQDYWKSDFIVFRDDNGVHDMLTPNILEDQTVKGSQLEVQKIVQHCHNDNAFAFDVFTHKGQAMSMAASPIPFVCETNEASGVLVFVTRCGHSCPSDLDPSLTIFGRIIANWLTKYNECVEAREQKNRASANSNGAMATASPLIPAEVKE